MRRGVAVAAVVLLLLVTADLLVTAVAERRAAGALCGDPDVQLGPWPVAARVLAGRTVAFTAAFDDTDLAALVPLPPAVAAVRIEDGRLRLVTTAGPTVPADLVVTGEALVVTPVLGPFELGGLALRVPLAGLPEGLVLSDVAVAGSTVTASGSADPRLLGAAEGPPSCPLGVS